MQHPEVLQGGKIIKELGLESKEEKRYQGKKKACFKMFLSVKREERQNTYFAVG